MSVKISKATLINSLIRSKDDAIHLMEETIRAKDEALRDAIHSREETIRAQNVVIDELQKKILMAEGLMIGL